MVSVKRPIKPVDHRSPGPPTMHFHFHRNGNPRLCSPLSVRWPTPFSLRLPGSGWCWKSTWALQVRGKVRAGNLCSLGQLSATAHWLPGPCGDCTDLLVIYGTIPLMGCGGPVYECLSPWHWDQPAEPWTSLRQYGPLFLCFLFSYSGFSWSSYITRGFLTRFYLHCFCFN